MRLQKQAYDHVLKAHERERNAFEKIAWYILENPVRVGLVKDRDKWAYSGCIVPGFPDWKPSGCHAVTGAATGLATNEVRKNVYWPRFWREYERKRGGRSATEVAATP